MTKDMGATTVADICRLVGDALLPVTPPAPDIPIRGIHISDLLDPTPYLDGGELLLTTGLLLPSSPAGCRSYVGRLVDRGVAALALGLGPVHQDVPPMLQRVCARRELPLLVVPDGYPFQTVTRTFWSLVGAERTRVLSDALVHQHHLVAAAAHPQPVPGLLARLAEAIGGYAVLTDLAGRPVLTSKGEWPADPEEVIRVVGRLRHAGPYTSATFPCGGETAVLHPIVSAGQVVSYLVAASSSVARPESRNVILMTLALLGMEATHRRTSRSADRVARAAVAHLVDRGLFESIPDLCEDLGVELPPPRVRMVVAEGLGGATLDELVGLLPGHESRWWGATTDHDAWVLLHPRLPEPDPADLSARLAESGAPLRIFIGPVMPLEDVHLMRTRMQLRCHAVRPGGADSWRSGSPVPFVTREWAEVILRPLRGAGDEVLATVHAYLKERGNWEHTANALGVHRNSVRSRIAKAEAALGERLTDPDTMARVWLALRETAVAPGAMGTRSTKEG